MGTKLIGEEKVAAGALLCSSCEPAPPVTELKSCMKSRNCQVFIERSPTPSTLADSEGESMGPSESEETASEESPASSTCSRFTKSVTFSDSCSIWSPEDLFASEGEDDSDDVPLLSGQPTASTPKSSKQSRDSKAAATQKLIEAAYSAALTDIIMQSQINQWQMAQMMQCQYFASADQAGLDPKTAQWKEGDTFEVVSALVTCDKSKMRVEPAARGIVMRMHHARTVRDAKWMPRTTPTMGVKFDNSKHCKRICPDDYHKLRKVVHC